MKVNEKIFNLRKQHGLSQEELAEKLNVSRQTISKWELGESTPDFDKIIPICELFDITTEDLLRDNKSFKPVEESENKPDITKAILICVSIFLYFIAIIGTIVTEEIFQLNDGLVATTFLTFAAIATVILVFTLLTRKSPKPINQNDNNNSKPITNSVISIFTIVTVCIYLLVSFLTGAWHITWIIWIVYALGVEIIKLICHLKGVDIDE